jgi:hypothetical protein
MVAPAAPAEFVGLTLQLRQLGDVGGDAPGLVAGGGFAAARRSGVLDQFSGQSLAVHSGVPTYWG